MGNSDSTFHEVCRDCEKEELARSERDARLAVEDHAASVSHRIEFSRVNKRHRTND